MLICDILFLSTHFPILMEEALQSSVALFSVRVRKQMEALWCQTAGTATSAGSHILEQACNSGIKVSRL